MIKIYNLQVLDVGFQIDPNVLCNLVNLRHLIDGPSTIANVGKMTSLQELEVFKVGRSLKFSIGQIQSMNELVLIRVYRLQNVKSKGDACVAILIDKPHLNELCLSWNNRGKMSELRAKAGTEVLEGLEPHHNLKHLQIIGYGSVSSPTWLATNLSVVSLQTLYLENCRG